MLQEHITRVEEMDDLGVRFKSNGTFDSHIEWKASKGMQMTGFIRRTCVGFKEAQTLKMLFNAYVRSHLEYASLVWLPFYDVQAAKIEKVQRRFTRYNMLKCGMTTFELMPSYIQRCKILNLVSLEERRKLTCILFAFDVLTGRIDSEFIRSKFIVNIQRDAARYLEHFVVPFHRCNYGKFEPISVMIRFLNDAISTLNLTCNLRENGLYQFNISRNTLKEKVINNSL
jgi:hypothetical protein